MEFPNCFKSKILQALHLPRFEFPAFFPALQIRLLSVLHSQTLFRTQLKSKKRWKIQIPFAKSQKSLFLKKLDSIWPRVRVTAAATTTPEAAQGLF